MTWIKLDDRVFNSPAFLSVSKDAKLLHIAGLCYAGANLTDGEIPAGALPILGAQSDVKATRKATAELIAAGLWRESEGGYQIVGYLEHNSSAADVQEKRKAAKERMKEKRSQNVRANILRTSREVRLPDTETETNAEPEDEKGVAEGDGGVAANWGAPRPAPAARPNPKAASETGSSRSRNNGKTPSPTVPPAPGRRSDSAVQALIAGYNAAKGIPDSDVTGKNRGQAFNVLKHAPAWVGPAEVEACTRYFLADPFYQAPGKLTVQKVAATLEEWNAAGRPVSIAAVRSRSSSGGSSVQRAIDYVRRLEEQGL